MFAHTNIWRLTDAGSSTDDTAAREIGTRLAQENGFHSYTLVRTGEKEVVAITIFDSEEHLEEAMSDAAEFVLPRVPPYTQLGPERRRGDVLYHTSA
jgi:heme-degrading monooxygenase HmoA